MGNNRVQLLKHALAHRNIWGRYATRQYLANRQVPMYLWRLIQQLEAAKCTQQH
jgi:hypothetical protein